MFDEVTIRVVHPRGARKVDFKSDYVRVARSDGIVSPVLVNHADSVERHLLQNVPIRPWSCRRPDTPYCHSTGSRNVVIGPVSEQNVQVLTTRARVGWPLFTAADLKNYLGSHTSFQTATNICEKCPASPTKLSSGFHIKPYTGLRFMISLQACTTSANRSLFDMPAYLNMLTLRQYYRRDQANLRHIL